MGTLVVGLLRCDLSTDGFANLQLLDLKYNQSYEKIGNYKNMLIEHAHRICQ